MNFLLLLASLVQASELPQTLLSADAAYFQGRFDDAEKAYRYASALDPNHLGATVNLALLLRDTGKPDEALPLWVKAGFLAPQEPAVAEGRGWALLQVGRFDEAHEAFKRAVVLSTAAPSWTVYLGDALAFARDKERTDAVRRLKSAVLAAPQSAAPVALLGRLLEELGERGPAIAYFRQALNLDPRMREAQEGLARVVKAIGEPEAAWQLATALLQTDRADPSLIKLQESIRPSLRKRPDDLLPTRRLSWPLVSAAQPIPALSKTEAPIELRVALFADAAGEIAEISSFTFVCNTAFRVIDSKLGEVAVGGRMEAWRAAYDPATRLISVRSVRGEESYATRNPVELRPSESGADFVIKDAHLPDAGGRDRGDRELRGRLHLDPAPAGLRVLAELNLEDYVRGTVAASAPNARYEEALKAMAVVVRSRAKARLAGANLHPGAGWSHCDSAHCGLFLGVQEEFPLAAAATEKTRLAELTHAGAPVEAPDHLACGGRTDSAEGLGRDAPWLSAVSDRSLTLSGVEAPIGPWGLEQFARETPTETIWDLAAHPGAETSVRWTRVLEAAQIEQRLQRLGLKGRFLDLRPGARTPGGRLLEMQAVGSLGTLTLKGEREIERALSPGSLRSTLFTMVVMRKGGRPDSILLFGAGTGHGLGLCRLGADGLAASGKDYKSILAHYFPKSVLSEKKSLTRR